VPKVSIIVTHFNQVEYLDQTLLSIYQQVFTDWECILVDDGSEPQHAVRAEQTLERLADTRFTWLALPRNLGVVAARRAGVEKSRGQYLLFVDGDDALEPSYLTETTTVLDTRSDLAFVYTQLQYFGAKQEVFISKEYSVTDLLFENYISVTSLIRRSAYQKVGGFRLALNRLGLEDWDLFLSMAEKRLCGVLISKPLVKYRQHTQEQNRNRPEKVRGADIYIRNHHPKLFGWRYKILIKWRTLVGIFHKWTDRRTFSI